MPWIIRNYTQSGQILVLSTASGSEFYAGNNKGVERNGIDYNLAPSIRKYSDLDSFETNAIYRRKAFDFILNNKKEAFSNFIDKILIYLSNPQKGLDIYGILVPLGMLIFYFVSKHYVNYAGTISLGICVLFIFVCILLRKNSFIYVIAATGNFYPLMILGGVGMFYSLQKQLTPHIFFIGIYILGLLVAGVIIPQYRQRYVLDSFLCIYAL